MSMVSPASLTISIIFILFLRAVSTLGIRTPFAPIHPVPVGFASICPARWVAKNLFNQSHLRLAARSGLLANPVQGDFRSPGSADGALMTTGSSTNGLTEYIGTNFSGAMQGNLIAACYDGRVLRIALSPDGTAVTNGVETLATGFGNLPSM